MIYHVVYHVVFYVGDDIRSRDPNDFRCHATWIACTLYVHVCYRAKKKACTCANGMIGIGIIRYVFTSYDCISVNNVLFDGKVGV